MVPGLLLMITLFLAENCKAGRFAERPLVKLGPTLYASSPPLCEALHSVGRNFSFIKFLAGTRGRFLLTVIFPSGLIGNARAPRMNFASLSGIDVIWLAASPAPGVVFSLLPR
jgi:hypothetical protein